MNNLEHSDACVPKDFEEYLMVYRTMEENGIAGYRPYEYRVKGGENFYKEYPNIYWSGEEQYVCGTRSSIPIDSSTYNLLSVEEFIEKAGILRGEVTLGYLRRKHNKGNKLKHSFI